MLPTRCIHVWKRLNCYSLVKRNQLVAFRSTHAASTKKIEQEEDCDAPIKFSTSPARQWKAQVTRQGYVDTRLWYEPYVILASLTIFLIYFTILREENDIDEELGRSLYSRIEGLEEYQLRLSLKYNIEHNKDTSALIKRLQEIEDEKKNK